MKQRNKQKRRWDFFFSAKPVRFYWSKSHVNIWNLLQPSRWNWFSGCNVGVAIFQWCLTYKFLVSRPCFSTDYITSTCALCYKLYMARTYICILVVFGTPIFPSYFIILMLSYGIFSPIKYDFVICVWMLTSNLSTYYLYIY